MASRPLVLKQGQICEELSAEIGIYPRLYLSSNGALKTGGDGRLLRWGGSGIEAVKLWNPRDESSSQLVFDDESSISTTASSVDTWLDSVNAQSFGQPTPSYRPTLIGAASSPLGRRYVSFNGTSQFLFCRSTFTGDLLKSKAAAWSFAVYRKRSLDASPIARSIFFSPTAASTTTTRLIIAASSDQTGFANRALLQARRLDANGVTRLHGSETPSTNWLLRFDQIDWSAAKAELHLNGVLSAANAAYGTSGSTSNTQAALNHAAIGGVAETNGWADVDLAAIVVGTGVVASTDLRDRLFGWAAHRYGLTANLPSDHPYKTTPP